jgi:hypothetical protein
VDESFSADYAERLKIGVEPKIGLVKAVDSIFAPANADEKCRVPFIFFVR